MIRLWGHKSKSIALTVVLALFATLFTALPSSATDVAPTSISPSSLGTLYTNLTMNQPLEANGSPAAEITVSAGTLPDGITLSTGSLLGTPITTGAYSFTLTATNTAGSFSQAYSGEITNGKPGSISPAQMPVLTAGSQSVVRFTTDGNPTGVLSLASGTVPTGMTYSMGSISGTPTSPGAYAFTLRSTNAFGTKDVIYSGSVLQKAPTSITPATIGSIYTNAATAITFASNAIPSANFEVSAGTLPAGLSLNATTGQLAGTATTTGPYAFTIRISNDRGSLEQAYSGQVTDGTPTVFTPSALPSIDATDSVSVQITADGNPTPTYAIHSGSLPTGLTLSSSGLLSGSTTATGAYSFTVRATNAGGSADITYSGDIRPKAPSAITPASLGNLYMTQSVNITVASVAYPSVVLSISAGALPTGLAFNTGTGVISGTPTAAGAYSFTIDATQSSSSTTISRTYSGVVRTGSITAITPAQIADIPGGINYSLQLQSDSFPAATFAVTSGALPTGLTLSSAGLISGNPSAAGAFTFEVTGTATDTTTVAHSYTVNVINAAPTQITPSAMPTLTAGSALTSPVQLASNGLPSSTFSISGGILPAGLALDGATGVISGTPTNAGAYSFTVSATNSAGSFSKTYAGNIQSRTCPTSTCVLNNSRIRFGDGSENSINQAGLVNQPWYFSAVANGWKKLTFASYPLNMAIAIGSAGSGYPRGYVTDLSANAASMTSQDIDYREFVITNTAGGASIGYGKITVKGTFTNVRNQSGATVSIEVTHIYELGQEDNFVKITTRVKNLDAANLNDVTVLVGTQDDYVGNNDRPTKVKGNLVNGVFTPIAAATDPAAVLQITSGAEGVLFYSTTAGVNMSMSSCCSFANAYSVNPTASPITLTNDGSYAAHLPFGVLASGSSTDLTWFYAAGATSDLSAVTQAIASAAAPVAPRVARGNGQGTLTWEAPVSTDPIVNYTVRYKATTDSGWTNVPLRSPSTTTSEVVTGLVNGNTYIFQVAAISHSVSANIDVTGAWSATSAPALIGYPDAPTITSVTGANGQVTISLTPGQSDASPILGYDYSVDGGVTWITIEPADPAMTSYTITGLPNGGAYQVQLRARNVYGTSTASNTYEAYTNPVWIDRFLNGMVTGLPYNDGIVAGANISNYSISSGTLPAGLTLNTSTGTITGTPTTVGAYSFTISAQNGAATLSQSFSGTVTNFGFTPATPSFNLDVSSPFSATIFGSDSVGIALSPAGATFSWVSGSLPNGVTATFVSNGVYGVYPNVSFSGQPTATGTFTRVLRLTDGTGRTSDVTLTFTVVRALSGQPTLGTPTLSGDTITVPFTEGTAGSTPITSYQYSLDNGVTWITYTGGTTSPLVISGLTDGNFYQIKIRAVNDAGPSTASTAFDLLMNPGFSVRTLSPFVKDVPYTGGLTAGYQVTYTITGTLPTGVTFDANTGQFSGTPTTLEAYSFVVRATNATGFTELTFTGSVVPATVSSGVDTVAVSPKALPRLAPITSESGKTPGEISSVVGKDNVKGGPVLKVNADSLAIEAPDWTITIQALSPDGKPVAPTSSGGLTVEANHKVDLGGRGFLAGSMVAFYVMSTPIFLGELEVTADGKFAGSLPLPAGLELGKHTLQIRGYSPDRDTRAVSLGFALIEKRVQTKTFKFEVRFKPNSSVVDNASKLALLKFIRQVPQSALNSKLVIAGTALDYQKSIAGTIAKKRVDSVLKIVRSAPVKLQPFKSVSVVPAKVGPSGRAAKLNLTFSYSVVIGG